MAPLLLLFLLFPLWLGALWLGALLLGLGRVGVARAALQLCLWVFGVGIVVRTGVMRYQLLA